MSCCKGDRDPGCGGRCVCLPYNDGCMIAAQLISIAAFLISWIWWVTFLIGLACMVLLQVFWCCRNGREGMVVSAVICCVTGLLCFVAGIIMLVSWRNYTNCSIWALGNDYSYDNYIDDYYYRDRCNEVAWSIVAFVTGFLWLTVAGCIVHFVKSGRHAKWEASHPAYMNNNDNSHPHYQSQTAATAVAIEMGTVMVPSRSAEATPPSASAAYAVPAVATAAVVQEIVPGKVEHCVK